VSRPRIVLADDRIQIGERLSISFQRTLRIPDDGRTYPLPPGLGRFPVRRASDFSDVLPDAWRADFLIPMYRREALWISFEGALWKPNAVKVGVGGIDAISGGAWNDELQATPQNYIVAPDQPWLDGINSGTETVRQFVAVPIGEGHTIEGQLTGEEQTGGIQIAAFEPLPGKFPDSPPIAVADRGRVMSMAKPSKMGIGAGGTMRQKIYPDKHGIETWDVSSVVSFHVHLISAAEFSAITGEAQPPSPVDAAAYTSAGFPWFDLYDEHESDIDAAEVLSRIRSIRELEKGAPEAGLDVNTTRIRHPHSNE
jgi:hypothetical protein